MSQEGSHTWDAEADKHACDLEQEGEGVLPKGEGAKLKRKIAGGKKQKGP